MKNKDVNSKLYEVLAQYFDDKPEICKPYGNGHINDTFLVENTSKYILQRMNQEVFHRPDLMMENILGITEHIRKKVQNRGGDISRATIEVCKTLNGAHCYKDSDGEWWRLCRFTDRTVTKDKLESPYDFYICGKGFGQFQMDLAGYPASTLHTTIENFHNTPIRLENLKRAIEADVCGRVKDAQKEIKFALEREEFANTLEKANREGRLPIKVTHNDTKLNNILLDESTGEVVCVIDLDTVMPGYSVNDFGDSIRFGANTTAEDETDLSLVSLDMEMFEGYAKGFLEGCGAGLSDDEIQLLPVGAMMMTYECGVRFLTDYLSGDTYFKIHRPGHNLDRCRNQFALLCDMEAKRNEMDDVIKRLKK